MITIGFTLTTYTVAESAGSVNITVNVLNGTLARDVHVLFMTSLIDGTATGIEFLKNNYCCQSFFYVILMGYFSYA